ncbi:siderophore-interacting protein [Streptomyces acidiscabies]|uniref:siderophore-interacting protein n=1 Tax=Streptomyces acidiscabies TaxID=42234 RepID=UPI0038F71BAC
MTRTRRISPSPVRPNIDIDFVLHTPTGPASAWADRAVAGTRAIPNSKLRLG